MTCQSIPSGFVTTYTLLCVCAPLTICRVCSLWCLFVPGKFGHSEKDILEGALADTTRTDIINFHPIILYVTREKGTSFYCLLCL